MRPGFEPELFGSPESRAALDLGLSPRKLGGDAIGFDYIIQFDCIMFETIEFPSNLRSEL